MNIILSSQQYAAIGLILALTAPTFAFGATPKPDCLLTAATANGSFETDDSATVQLVKGDAILLSWEGKNAIKAFDDENERVSLTGTTTLNPVKSTDFSIIFTNGKKRTTCELSIEVVSGSFKESALESRSTKPMLSGKASGLRYVEVRIFEDTDEKPVWSSKKIRVKKDAWKVKVSKRLAAGSYTVALYGDRKSELNTIATDTLTIGSARDDSKDKTVSTSIVVEPIPLLLGGLARTNSSVAVSYLQVLNTGDKAAFVEGFDLKQTGSASTDSIVGLRVVDDKGTFETTIGGKAGDRVFRNGVAHIPANVLIPAGDMRLFTIKAILAGNLIPYLGTQLKLNVTDVDTNAKTNQASYPIRGTTWTIAI